MAPPHRSKAASSPRREIGAGKCCGASYPRIRAVVEHHFLWELWRMVHVSTETADEGLHGACSKRAHLGLAV